MVKRTPLEGIRIVDLSYLVMGPLITKFLADYGAEVIKVEWGKRIDPLRIDGAFSHYNTSKYSLTLNLNNNLAKELLKKLLMKADIVVENFRPGVLQKMGLDYEELRKIKADIIMLSSSIYGQTGPYTKHGLVGTYVQAETGFMHLTGWPDRPSSGLPTPYTDYIAPWFAMSLLLSALDYRKRTGKGQYLDISQIETSPHFMGPALMDYIVNGRIETRNGNRSEQAVPHGVFPCQGNDRWCSVAVFNDREWDGFCRAIGNPAWTKEERFATFIDRKKNEDELESLIGAYTINQMAEDIALSMQREGVASYVVENAQDLMERDVQLKDRGFFAKLEHPETGSHYVRQTSFKLSSTPAEPRSAPRLGEHNEYICTQVLNMTKEEYERLSQNNVFE